MCYLADVITCRSTGHVPPVTLQHASLVAKRPSTPQDSGLYARVQASMKGISSLAKVRRGHLEMRKGFQYCIRPDWLTIVAARCRSFLLAGTWPRQRR